MDEDILTKLFCSNLQPFFSLHKAFQQIMLHSHLKLLNQPGDYYICSLCASCHCYTNDPSSTGMARTTKMSSLWMMKEKTDKSSKLQEWDALIEL